MANQRLVQYFYAPISAYSYLGEPRLMQIARESGACIEFKPLDIIPVFAAAQVTPPAKQSAARLAYRQQDLARTAQRLTMPLNPKPLFWPVPMALSARVIIAAEIEGADQHTVSMAIMTAIQSRDKDISNPETLHRLLLEADLDAAAIMETAQAPEAGQRLDSNIAAAIACGVAGAPSYVVDDQLFFGQDKLVDLAWWLSQ